MDPSPGSEDDGGTGPDGSMPADDDPMNDEVSDEEDEDAGLRDAGDDATVRPTDPCAAAPCDAEPLARCEDTGGENFSCHCPEGFDGSGVGSAGCTPLLAALALEPVPLEESFVSTTLSYSATVPPWVERVSLTVEAPELAIVNVDGQPVEESGAIEIALPVGDHDIVVEVSAGEASRSYVVAVRRVATQSYLKADYPSTSSYGYAVSLSGDRLAVGALGESSNGNGETNTSASGSGAAFIMRRGADGVWKQEKWFKSSDPIASQRFGTSVSLSGTRLAVGAKWEASDGINRRNNAFPESGAVYVFELDDMGVWRERAYLKANPPGRGQEFGLSVAIEGDLLAVGEPDPGTAGASGPRSSGSVWIYRREVDAAGKIDWKFETRLVARNADFDDYFGHRISLSGSRIAIGARAEDGDGTSEDNNDLLQAGAAYVFRRNEDHTWTQEAYLKASAPTAGGSFGANLSLKGDLLAVGAPSEVIDGATKAGAVYLFEADPRGGFRPLQRIQEELVGRNEAFGRGVALDAAGEWLFVGADQDRSAVSHGYGAVFGYRRVAPDHWELRTTLSAEHPDERDLFGYDIAVDQGRVAISAPSEGGNREDGPEDNSVSLAGAVYMFD
jgi:hypothetical protein